MEPTIKSEPCEDLYREQESFNQPSFEIQEGNESEIRHLQLQKSLKRVYNDMETNLHDHKNANQHFTNKSYYPSVDYANASHQLQDNFHYNKNNAMPEPNQSTIETDGRPLKKYKRFEENVLFNPPFFKLALELSSPSPNGAIAARCYTCGKVVRGNRGISSNFIKHMKRSHPEINKIYEDYKAHKIKPGHLPNLANVLKVQLVTGKSATVENVASGSDSNTAYSNDDTNQFFEGNEMLEANATLNSSDDSEDPLNPKKKIIQTDEILKPSRHHVKNSDEASSLELSTKTLEALGDMIDEKLKRFVKHNEYDQLNEKVNSLITCNQTEKISSGPALTELKNELNNLKKECAVLRLAVQQSQASRRQLQNELQAVDKLLHQRKLIIRNLPVCNPKQPLDSVKKLFRETLNLDDIQILNCCIIPSIKNSMESNKECLSVELISPQACKAIFRQTHKLKNTGIFIESEISPFQRKRKNKLMVLRKELLRRKPDLKVLVRNCTLVVNGKNFYWDDVEGLCHDCKDEAIELNGIEYLNFVTGLDLKEFIHVLKNYNVQIT